MKAAKFTIVGVCPLIMHNIQLADRRNPIAKEMAQINAKKTKRTESDYERLQELEWRGGLYLNEQGAPFIQSDAIIGCLISGAKKTRNGKDAESGVWCDNPPVFKYDGPKDLDKLYEDKRFVDYRAVAIQKARIMRTRPKFPTWSCSFELTFDESVTSEKVIRGWLETAGASCGLADFRPRFGRFVVE